MSSQLHVRRGRQSGPLSGESYDVESEPSSRRAVIRLTRHERGWNMHNLVMLERAPSSPSQSGSAEADPTDDNPEPPRAPRLRMRRHNAILEQAVSRSHRTSLIESMLLLILADPVLRLVLR